MTRLICRSGKSTAPTFVFYFFNLKRIVCAQKILNCYFLILNYLVPLQRDLRIAMQNLKARIISQLKQLKIWQS